jgi:hypothetical protein
MIRLTPEGIEKVKAHTTADDFAKGVEQMERLALQDNTRCITVPFVTYVHFEEGVDYERDKVHEPKRPRIESELWFDADTQSFRVNAEDILRKRRGLGGPPFDPTVRFTFPAMTLFGMKIEP